MDILSRVKSLLSGKKTQKRKSLLTEEYDADNSKRFRMSELNGDCDSEPYNVNSGINFETAPSSRNHIRRSDSYRNSGIKSSYLTFDRSINEQNDANSHYNTNNGAESHWSDFKQPMPPPMTNGTKRLPGLINATRPLAERKMFQRNVNQPHQTISPHYSQFGDSQHSVLGQFKAVPDLYRIKPIRSNISTSFSTSNLANGHDQSQYSSLTGTQLNRRSALNMPNSQSTSNLMTNNNSFLSNSISRRFQSSHLQTPSSFSKNYDQIDPPENLSKEGYKKMLNLIPGFLLISRSKKNAVTDENIIELIGETEKQSNTSAGSSSTVPPVERVNSLKTRLETNEVFSKQNWEQSLHEKYSAISLSRRDSLRLIKEENNECEKKRRDVEDRLQETFKKIDISSIVPEEEEEPPNDYPVLQEKQQMQIYQWISGRDTSTVLMTKFNLSISRHDIQTLRWDPLTWLNDEVINFYMELLAERSRQNEKMPKVHGMNTFFLKRLLETGYSGVRRWTRKVDIFSFDIIPVPVHKGIHWCMAIIHLKNKTIKYYDSMGAPNGSVLSALAEYLKAESLDKKKAEFDMTGWTVENVRNIPQQENGSDCGVFSCMYAEFITRNRPIVFTQQHMTYFRMKMVYEICTGQMLN